MMLPAVIILVLLIYADMNLEPFQRRISHSCVLFVRFVMAATLEPQTQKTTSPEAHFALRDSIFGGGSGYLFTLFQTLRFAQLSMRGVLGLIPNSILLRTLATFVPVVAGALFLDNSAAVTFVYMCVLQRLTTICLAHRYTVKFKVYFCLAVAVAIPLVLIFIRRGVLQDRIYSDSDPVKWGCLLFSTLILLLPFNILCMLLHFENYIASPPVIFHLHINDIIFAFTQYELENVPPPYWAMAFCALVASFIVSAAISATGLMTFRMEEVGIFAALIAAPSMIGISLLRAARKGQLKYLWEYEEDRGTEKEKAGVFFYTVPPIDDDAAYPYTLPELCDSLKNLDTA